MCKTPPASAPPTPPATAPGASAAVPNPVPLTWADAVALLAALAVLVVFRLHAFPAAFEVDECNYAYAARRLLQGGRLYIDFWDHQPPAMFALATCVAGIAGSEPLTFRVLAVLTAGATLLILYTVARQHLGRAGAVSVAMLFAIVSSDPGVAGEGWNRELFMNLLLVMALHHVLQGGWRHYLAAGVLLGVASLFKTVVAAQWLGLALAAVLADGWQRPRSAWATIFWLAIGPVAAWLATLTYFAATGRGSVFVDAVFVYNLTYGQVDESFWSKMTAFFATGSVFSSALPLWLAGATGLILLPWRGRRRWSAVLTGLAVGSFVAVCLPGRFWHHYFMLMLPVLVLGAGSVVAQVTRATARGRAWTPALYGLIVCGLALGWQWHFYLRQPAEKIAWHRYGGRMTWARAVGRLVGDVTEPGDPIYFAGIDVGVYYYSHRTCATRYTLPTFLSGAEPGVPRRQQIFLDELRKNPPRLIGLVAGTPYLPPLDTFIRERGYRAVAEAPPGLQILVPPDQPIRAVDWSAPAAALAR